MGRERSQRHCGAGGWQPERHDRPCRMTPDARGTSPTGRGLVVRFYISTRASTASSEGAVPEVCLRIGSSTLGAWLV